MSVRKLIKSVAPPALLEMRRRRLGQQTRFHGRPANWAEACAMSSGYGSPEILDRVVAATRAVVSGQALFERDSVLFDDVQYPLPLLAGLCRAAALEDGRLEVVDFGGSLGSTYRQCRPFLSGVTKLIDWWVVEQPHYVAAGRKEFSTAELRFAKSLAETGVPSPGRVILASSVLQYVEDPGASLSHIGQRPARHLLIDRTPLTERAEDRLCIQRVPKQIYQASYPCWILSRPALLTQLRQQDWAVVCEFSCPEGVVSTDDGMEFEFRGLILERKV